MRFVNTKVLSTTYGQQCTENALGWPIAGNVPRCLGEGALHVAQFGGELNV